MEGTGKRLKQLIDTKGISLNEFSQICGISQPYLSGLINEKKAIGIQTALKILEHFPDATLDWLFKGEEYHQKELSLLNESPSSYGIDPMEKVFLSYLDKPSVRKKIQEITKNEDELTLKLNVGEENSELIDRLEKMIQKDLTSQKSPKLRVITDKTKDDEGV